MYALDEKKDNFFKGVLKIRAETQRLFCSVATAMNGSYDVNSVVIDFSIEPTPTRLQHPLVVQFEHLRVRLS